MSPAEFSGEQAYTLDALVTLEAKNSSGSELRSYFINVVPPEITVNTFTVWVRSEGASSSPANLSGIAAKSGGGRLNSKIYIPDPNFPEKLVELVPDPAASNGYRVEIYQPERELQKGEQVMLEWNIGGVDTVHIAPFTEELPNIGVQPFFPQESMNFVMTAKSGELEQLFMLPVKVFDGEPPEPPTIEFFQASPSKLVGAGAVEFAWSVSGEWTRVQIASGENIIADYLNPQGFVTAIVSETATFILTAWNNDLSSALPLEVVIDPTLINVGLYFKSVFPESGRFPMFEKVQVTMGFYDPAASDLTSSPPKYVEPEIDPTGEIFVTDGVSICTVTLPALTCDLVFTTPGDPKLITANYPGDDIYLSASTVEPMTAI